MVKSQTVESGSRVSAHLVMSESQLIEISDPRYTSQLVMDQFSSVFQSVFPVLVSRTVMSETTAVHV